MTTAVGLIIPRRAYPVEFAISQDPELSKFVWGDFEISHTPDDAFGLVTLRYKGIGKTLEQGVHKRISVENGNYIVEITHEGSPEFF